MELTRINLFPSDLRLQIYAPFLVEKNEVLTAKYLKMYYM